MRREELETLLRSVSVNENTVTAMLNAFDIGYEEGSVEEQTATLQAIDAIYDTQDPTPMYEDGYNHALDNISQFVKARKKP
jgi:hypothetical protein